MSLVRLAIIVLALAGAVGLALSNPTMDDYLQFVEQELGRAVDRMDQRTPSREQQFIRDVFRSQSKKLIAGVVRPATVRYNWGLVSQYETRIADAKVVVLGIGGRFIPVKGLEEATLKIGRMAF
jgi:phage shock protein PspC (stress-responsive transcriptional regulator)